MPKSFERGSITEWQGNRGIVMKPGTGAWFRVRAYNMEPDGHDVPVEQGEDVAFAWVHEGNRMIVTRCVRLGHTRLPESWAQEDWPPQAGRWCPRDLIGNGRNGEVWAGRGPEGKDVAIKYLRRATDESYKRFRAEIEIMSRLAGTEGVLPLLDHRVPDVVSLTDPAWLVTPLAIPLIGSAATTSFENTVAAFAKVSDTLTSLAEQGISHRDLKPDNLFWLDNAPAIGDFGLVDFPGKETVTTSHEKLGPRFYLAPEMLAAPHRADGRPADVYTLAKCFWVVATGQKYPIPGEQRESVHQTRLSTYVAHRRARQLDRLIARCTRHNSQERPTMAEFRNELRSWLNNEGTALRPRYPRRFEASELAKFAVDLEDSDRIILRCNQCGKGWSPNILRGGKLPRGYWRCPNRCNSD